MKKPYLDEAEAIVAGQTCIPVLREHLEALALSREAWKTVVLRLEAECECWRKMVEVAYIVPPAARRDR